MGEFVTIKLPQSEMDKFSRWTDSLSKENKQKCQTLVTSTILHIDRLAKTLAPVDKGFLRSHIYTIFNSNKLGGGVYTKVKYAPFKEWGTGDNVSVPSFVKEMFGVDSMDWKGTTGRKVNSEPKPYLFESARVGWNELLAKLKLMGFR
jgi:hypothetical protein